MEPEFSPEVLSYRVDLGIASETIELSATTNNVYAEILIGQEELASGAEQSLAIPFGEEAIEIVVRVGQETRTYGLTSIEGARLANEPS